MDLNPPDELRDMVTTIDESPGTKRVSLKEFTFVTW
jgi:hypothetical protein